MKQYTIAQNQTQIEMSEVQKQFKDWRKNRKKRSYIPELLWDAAVKLYPKYSPYEISKALRVHYGRLKIRILNACKPKTALTVTKKRVSKEKKRELTIAKKRTLTLAKKRTPKDEKKKTPAVLKPRQSQTIKAINSPPAFMQLDIPYQQTVAKEWSIEMENVDGAKMKISGKSIDIPNLILICQNFSRGKQ